ncbi:hypothetical protein N9L68_03035 [bacterium]|nr:hypothetical protein [bacterium]
MMLAKKKNMALCQTASVWHSDDDDGDVTYKIGMAQDDDDDDT